MTEIRQLSLDTLDELAQIDANPGSSPQTDRQNKISEAILVGTKQGVNRALQQLVSDSIINAGEAEVLYQSELSYWESTAF